VIRVYKQKLKIVGVTAYADIHAAPPAMAVGRGL
jgi:hypothetical protein